jgi:hypothetical protein
MSDPPWGSEPPQSGSEFVRVLWRAGRDSADKKKQVVQAVADASHGQTRDQLRALFVEESARLGVPRDPIWVERALDELEWSPAERARQTARGLLIAGKGLTRLARSRGIPEAPSWMQPPPTAGYHVWAERREKTPVAVDADVTSWLDRVLSSAPAHVGHVLALVDVWFDWTAPRGERAAIAVYIGAQKVGALDQLATERFVTVMESARERNTKPRASATLAKAEHLTPPYLLVVEIPVPEGS